ncbi:hypothetical protein FB451DRAFT_1397391 [Mycena latifolia]|nr:hypothetical protein FB451DRAFT_1397391 [Mycena latifolia]
MTNADTTSITVSFRPRPPLASFWTHWLPGAGSLPYGPFHSIQGTVPTDATEHHTFDCSSGIWKFCVEYYQEIRSLLTPEPLDAASAPSLLHAGLNRYKAVGTFARRLRDHLELTGAVSIPAGKDSASDYLDSLNSGKWKFLVKAVSLEFPNPTMDGAMIQRKLWACIVYEVDQYNSM